MIAVPAVDLRRGRCVQLVGGRPEDERVALPDPVGVARRWWETGFARLHVVDLDAALGQGDNRDLVGAVCSATPALAQAGGGVRDDEAASAVLEAGADRVVVGTRAVREPDWLRSLAARHPGRVVVAADVRDGRVVTEGWTEDSGRDVEAFLAELAGTPLAGVLCTDVGREGRMEGVDRPAVERLVAASPHPLTVSGGVTTPDDLAFLADAGAEAAVLGMALYTGVLDPAQVAQRWGGRTDARDGSRDDPAPRGDEP